MIADLKPYPEYKDSGMPWLGQVPGHWEMRRGKTLFDKADRPVRPTDETVTCFRDGTVTLRKNRRVSGFTESLKEIGYQGVRRGDLVIHAMDAFAGAVGVSDADGKSSPVYSVCKPRNADNPHYFAAIVRHMAITNWILVQAKGIRERSTDYRFSDFGVNFLPVPPPTEQSAIVRFLNWANDRLDRAIRAKRKTIALLNEQKQAIIHRAVTRGLDPNVKLKDSGIPWLGKIPEHWEMRRLKHIFKRIFGGSTPASNNPHYWNGDIIWVTPADVSKSVFLSDSIRRISRQGLRSCSAELAPEGSVIITSRAPVGNVSFARVALCTNQGCKALIPDKSIIIPLFAFWSLTVMKAELQSRASGTTFFEISTSKMSACEMALPTLGEQEHILAYIETETKSIETTITRLEREIELLREYRTRLTADLVTGKLDVRAAAESLPQTPASSVLSDVSAPSDPSDSSDFSDIPQEEPDQEDAP